MSARSTDVAPPYSSTIESDIDPAPRSRSLRIPARGAVVGSLASGVFAQGVLVVTGVVAARTLGPTDRGYLALVVLVPTVLVLAGNIGLPLATTYFMAKGPSCARSALLLSSRPAR
jgi:O-antigen/teichoic acid export membrane protein